MKKAGRRIFSVLLALPIITAAVSAKADYWNGTAPFCKGACVTGDAQIRTSRCGDGKCCWTGHKALCRPTAAGTATGVAGGGSACIGRQTQLTCYGVVEVCDDGVYSAPNQVWHSCHKYVCGACFISSALSLLSYKSSKCQSGFVPRGAVPGDEICVASAVHQAAVKDNEAAGSRRAPNGGASGPDSCKPGFVWREAKPNDHVCVTPQTRAQTASDNKAAASRVVDADKPYGRDTCKQGFVWREAIAKDHVCVNPAARDLARRQNEQAASRRSPNGGAYGPETCRSGFVWREAIPDDRVCVPPAERDQALAEAVAAAEHRAR